MKEILTISENTLYQRNDAGEYTRLHELIFAVSEPNYRVDAVGQCVKERLVETFRVVATTQGVEQISKILLAIISDDSNDKEKA